MAYGLVEDKITQQIECECRRKPGLTKFLDSSLEYKCCHDK